MTVEEFTKRLMRRAKARGDGEAIPGPGWEERAPIEMLAWEGAKKVLSGEWKGWMGVLEIPQRISISPMEGEGINPELEPIRVVERFCWLIQAAVLFSVLTEEEQDKIDAWIDETMTLLELYPEELSFLAEIGHSLSVCLHPDIEGRVRTLLDAAEETHSVSPIVDTQKWERACAYYAEVSAWRKEQAEKRHAERVKAHQREMVVWRALVTQRDNARRRLIGNAYYALRHLRLVQTQPKQVEFFIEHMEGASSEVIHQEVSIQERGARWGISYDLAQKWMQRTRTLLLKRAGAREEDLDLWQWKEGGGKTIPLKPQPPVRLGQQTRKEQEQQ